MITQDMLYFGHNSFQDFLYFFSYFAMTFDLNHIEMPNLVYTLLTWFPRTCNAKAVLQIWQSFFLPGNFTEQFGEEVEAVSVELGGLALEEEGDVDVTSCDDDTFIIMP